jgi:hypothetical protein
MPPIRSQDTCRLSGIILWLWFAGVQSSETLGEISNVAAVALYIGLFLSDKKE